MRWWVRGVVRFRLGGICCVWGEWGLKVAWAFKIGGFLFLVFGRGMAMSRRVFSLEVVYTLDFCIVLSLRRFFVKMW